VTEKDKRVIEGKDSVLRQSAGTGSRRLLG
jgi:hypothetical protein